LDRPVRRVLSLEAEPLQGILAAARHGVKW
jgi:hypothetical protein